MENRGGEGFVRKNSVLRKLDWYYDIEEGIIGVRGLLFLRILISKYRFRGIRKIDEIKR